MKLKDVTPGFKRIKPDSSYVCPGSPHTPTEYRISERMLYSKNILIISTYIRV
jgi:hypothetical protein